MGRYPDWGMAHPDLTAVTSAVHCPADSFSTRSGRVELRTHTPRGSTATSTHIPSAQRELRRHAMELRSCVMRASVDPRPVTMWRDPDG
jgi:hypothetical protein